MTEIIDSLSHPALEKAAEINYQNTTGFLGHLIAATFHHELDATWFVHGLTGLNMVVTTKITTDTPESKIDEILKRIAVSSEAPITWPIGPSMRNARLENRLQANGWSKIDELPMLVMDLHRLDTHLEKIHPD